MSNDKVVCENHRCGWHGTADQMLQAPHPFVPNDTLYFCPECKDVDCLVVACDEPGCWLPASCGTKTETGYRSTCHKHAFGINYQPTN